MTPDPEKEPPLSHSGVITDNGGSGSRATALVESKLTEAFKAAGSRRVNIQPERGEDTNWPSWEDEHAGTFPTYSGKKERKQR